MKKSLAILLLFFASNAIAANARKATAQELEACAVKGCKWAMGRESWSEKRKNYCIEEQKRFCPQWILLK